MTKAEVVQAIDAKLNLAQGCAMFAYILRAVPWRDTVKTFVGPGSLTIRSARFEHVLTFTPEQILKRYEHPNAVGDDGLNIIRLGVTDAICQAFESTRHYCVVTSQEVAFRAFRWYHFARLVRNCFSHNFRLDLTLPLSKRDRINGVKVNWLPPQTLTFSDGSVTLDQSLHGKELDFDILPIKYAFELLQMIRASVQSGLAG
jgi:hypothetical protein